MPILVTVTHEIQTQQVTVTLVLADKCKTNYYTSVKRTSQHNFPKQVW